jgi:hypothetical protein
MSSLLMSPGAAGVTTFPFSDIAWLPPGLGKSDANLLGTLLPL